jgi:hypothetical protein
MTNRDSRIAGGARPCYGKFLRAREFLRACGSPGRRCRRILQSSEDPASLGHRKMGGLTSTTIGAHAVSARFETRENSSMYAATVDHRCIRPQNDVHGKEASGIVRMRKGVSHGNMQCVHACLLAPLCNLDRVFECLPVPSGRTPNARCKWRPVSFTMSGNWRPTES